MRLRPTSRPAHPPAPLTALLLVATLVVVAWSLVLPAFQGPDEVLHFAEVQRLVDQRELLAPPGQGDWLSEEVQAATAEAGLGPLVGNLDARAAFTSLDEQRWRARDARLGGHRAQPRPVTFGPPIQGAARNPSLYTFYMAVPYVLGRSGSVFTRLALMRLWNIPLVLCTVACTWLLAQTLLPRRTWLATAAAAGVALLPEMGFIGGTVEPDALLIALTSAFLLAATRLIRVGPSVPRAVGLATLGAAATLTHPRGAVLIFAAPVAVALAAAGPRWRDRGARASLAVVSVITAAVVAVGVLAAHRSGVAVLGGSTIEGLGAPVSARQFVSYLWQFYLPKLPFMNPMIGPPYGFHQVYVETFWGTFGSLEVRFAPWGYDVLQAVTLVLLAAVSAALVRCWASVRARWREAAMIAGTAVGYVLSLHLYAYRTLLVDPTDPIIVGRYLLPFTGVGAVAVALVLWTLPRRVGGVLAGIGIGGLAALQLFGVGATLARFTL